MNRVGILRAIRALALVAPECTAIVFVVGLLWWGIAATLQNQLTSTMETTVRDTANLALAFEENTQRIIAGGDQVLLSLRSAYQRNGTQFDLKRWVAQESPPDWLTAQIAVIGPDGMSLASTASNVSVSVADRAHFIFQRDNPADELYISKPVLGRSSGRWTIQLTRKIMTPDGQFGGIVVLSVDCYQLSGFYETVRLQLGYIELVGLDGVVRARGPFEERAIGSHVDLRDQLGSLINGAGTVRQADGHDMLTVSYRRLRAYPLIVKVAFADRAVLAAYRHGRRVMVWSGLIATIVIGGVGIVWILQRKRAIEYQRMLALTLQNMDQGLVMFDAGEQIRVVNARALELLGLPPETVAAFRPHNADDRQAIQHAIREALARQTASKSRSMSDPAEAPNLELNISPIPEGGVIHTITDVTARHVADRRIRHMALHDHLTGLGNRAVFSDEADHMLATSGVASQPFGIVCLDLNGFKKVNDTFGHDGGDELLVEVAKRLSGAVPAGDLIVRSGGDEFAVLCRSPAQPEASRRVAADILTTIEEPFTIAGQQVALGACAGIAVFPTSGINRAELLRNADLALYAAKADRSNPIRVFEPEMAEGAQDRLRLEEEMRAAIGTDQFYLNFQPQFRTATLEPVGFEALVRWRHPTRGPMRPDLFIPLAEETGLIVPLGRQILEEACRAALQWPVDVQIAVNLSPVQFRDPQLLDTVVSVLNETGLAPSRLELEVTEGVLIADETQALEKLSALRALGVMVALDDFGTGYASLSYLQKFPFDTIKLDRSFVQAQVLEQRSRHILRSVLYLSRNLKLNVVAEGVETRTQLSLLREQGCPMVQGFLVGRPTTEQETLKMFPGMPPAGTSAPPRGSRNGHVADLIDDITTARPSLANVTQQLT